MLKQPLTLIIMDGYGILPPAAQNNAVAAAYTPRLDDLFASYPHTELAASGYDVGLPAGQMGNSEVGHTNIGAGRVVFQDLPRISKSIDDGDFFDNPAFLQAVADAKTKGKSLHLMGLLSDGGVHSHNTHLWALLELCKRQGLERVYIHGFLDGRDVPPRSGKAYVEECTTKCAEIGVGKIATLSGRYYAMDRDKQWERLELAYAAMVYGNGVLMNSQPVQAVQNSYDKDITDEFFVPTVIDQDGVIEAGDSVIFFNFRPDRAREITHALCNPKFDGFKRQQDDLGLTFVCMTEYEQDMPNVTVAYEPKVLKDLLGEVISNHGLTQLRIAETTKYAHVTFFFNGGEEKTYPGEDRVLIDTPDVATFDLKPEMSAYEVCDKAVELILQGNYDVVVLNFANPDMVGHSGNFDATVKAVEVTDECVGRVVDAVRSMGGISLVTADHGNADKMLDDDGVTPFTAHTTSPVPLILVTTAECRYANTKLRAGGKLGDIAPTMLALLGIEKPADMTGENLIV